MHAVALQAFRSATRPASRRFACRVIGGSRFPLSHRNFNRSAVFSRASENPPAGEGDKDGSNTNNSKPEPEPEAEAEAEGEGEKGEDGAEGANRVVTIEDLILTPRILRNGKSGSGKSRASRQKQMEGLPAVVLPEWFWTRNVKCVGDSNLGGTLAVYGTKNVNEILESQNADTIAQAPPEMESNNASDASTEEIESREVTDEAKQEILVCGLEGTDSAKYSMHVHVYKEILTSLRAMLALRPPRNTGNASLSRPITVLQCPKDGGTYYLDTIVETIASKLGADLVRLDAQDIAQIVGPYIDENLAWTTTTTALLAYKAHKEAGKMEEYDKESAGEEEDLEAAEEADDISKAMARFSQVMSKTGKGPRRNPLSGAKVVGISGFPFAGAFGMTEDTEPQQLVSEQDRWNDLKLTAVLEALVDGADAKRSKLSSASEGTSTEALETQPRDIIIQIRDFNEISKTTEGEKLITKLRNVIDKKWQAKRNIICVGTTSAEDAEPALAKADIQHLQSDIVDGGERRTIYVPPDRREEQDVAFETDEKARIRHINIRHVEDMIHKLVDGSEHLVLPIDIEKNINSAVAFAAGLDEAVWSFARVYRIAHTIVGSEKSDAIIDGTVFSEALESLAASDEAKFKWGELELKQEDDDAEALRFSGMDGEKKKAKEKLRELKKKCNQFEKKLLSGVVFPSDLHTTFADIRAPKETIEALQTLTSLSLLRPEAFSYGVLATDKIPGLLLYGPPGTGKTLLAKAVAKESGATVLEITAADLNDMFVGQGEKNVRAVFTLAKKLSPCVVFLDEADAIFSARSHHNRNAHREMINQFLREWDGMTTDLSAFIMVATNRPFDLDEAVLRRLPRRLLVDLPTEKDREAILSIHLKDEVLSPSVSLPAIAKNTPFYSGSDLKNLSVAAALACIREENTAAATHNLLNPDEKDKYQFAEKRTLTSKHFDKAMEEISASISEDMSTLTAIRKFDEKYGDRKGRRKKGPGLGFGGTRGEEKDSEGAMVRQKSLET